MVHQHLAVLWLVLLTGWRYLFIKIYSLLYNTLLRTEISPASCSHKQRNTICNEAICRPGPTKIMTRWHSKYLWAVTRLQTQFITPPITLLTLPLITFCAKKRFCPVTFLYTVTLVSILTFAMDGYDNYSALTSLTLTHLKFMKYAEHGAWYKDACFNLNHPTKKKY